MAINKNFIFHYQNQVSKCISAFKFDKWNCFMVHTNKKDLYTLAVSLRCLFSHIYTHKSANSMNTKKIVCGKRKKSSNLLLLIQLLLSMKVKIGHTYIYLYVQSIGMWAMQKRSDYEKWQKQPQTQNARCEKRKIYNSLFIMAYFFAYNIITLTF